MKLLLDTQVVIWTLSATHLLPKQIQSYILNEENDTFVSVATIWEIAIKFAKHGRMRMPLSASEIFAAMQESGHQILDIRAEHALAVERLNLPGSDPFDRMILAQALSEPLHLITKDRKLAGYSELVISW